MIYIIHFDRPMHHARHYVGYVGDGDSLDNRIKQHQAGKGAKILAAANAQGITWQVVRIMPGDRHRERQIKTYKCTPQYCPVCRQIKTKIS